VSFHKVIKSIAALVIFSLPLSCSEDGSSAQTLEFDFSFESIG